MKALTVFLNDGSGAIRKVYANAQGIVKLTPPADADFRRFKSVDVAPTDSFDPNEHYIVQVTEQGGKRSGTVLFGITPEYIDAFVDTVPDPTTRGAILICDQNTDLGPSGTIFV